MTSDPVVLARLALELVAVPSVTGDEMALADLVELVIVLYIGLVLVRALISFISVERSNPVVPLLFQLTEPVLRPIRKRIPAMGGFDFSPALAILAFMLALALLVAPLVDFGQRLAQAAA